MGNILEYQSTEHLLILLKACMDYKFTGLDYERGSLTTEIIKILYSRK